MPKPLDLQTVFVQRLVEARALRNESQRSLGLRLGLPEPQAGPRINGYENKRSSVALSGLDALAKALDVPAAYLVAQSAEHADAALLLSEGHHAGSDAAALALLDWLRQSPELHETLREWVKTPVKKRPSADDVIAALLQALQGAESGR